MMLNFKLIINVCEGEIRWKTFLDVQEKNLSFDVGLSTIDRSVFRGRKN